MKINKVLTVEEVEMLRSLGIVLINETGEARREKKVPPGMRQLPDGKLIFWVPIQELVNKW